MHRKEMESTVEVIFNEKAPVRSEEEKATTFPASFRPLITTPGMGSLVSPDMTFPLISFETAAVADSSPKKTHSIKKLYLILNITDR